VRLDVRLGVESVRLASERCGIDMVDTGVVARGVWMAMLDVRLGVESVRLASEWCRTEMQH
jgi:hypothetical protein